MDVNEVENIFFYASKKKRLCTYFENKYIIKKKTRHVGDDIQLRPWI